MPRIIRQTTFKLKWYHSLIVKYWWALIIIIFAIVFGLEYLFIIKPNIDQTINGRAFDIVNTKRVLQEQEEYLQKLKNLKAKTEKIDTTELQKLDFVLAKKAELPQILTQVSALAEQSGLTLIKFNLEYENGVIDIGLTFKGGSYRIIKEYLDLIEKNIRIMDVWSIEMKELGNIFSMKIKTYYLE